MYEQFFGLKALPFELTVDPKFLHLTPQHRESLSVLEYGLTAAKPLTLLVGEAGMGKTTLLRAALDSERCRHVQCVQINNPTLTRDEFFRTLAARFALPAGAGESKAALLEYLEADLRERRAAGIVTALVIDEAQRLPSKLLEEVRLLANIESNTEKFLPIVLVGQPELKVRLDEPGLRQLKQRVVLRCELPCLTLAQTAAYIASRLHTAGGVPARLFTREAVGLVHERAGGIPRTINVICDNALLTAMALGRHSVDQAIVQEVCDEAALRPAGAGRAAGPSATLENAHVGRVLPLDPDVDRGARASDGPEAQPWPGRLAGFLRRR